MHFFECTKRHLNLKSWILDADRLRLFTPFILSANPMSEEEAKAVQNIWSLSIIDRWRLYRLWIQMTSNLLLAKVKKFEGHYAATVRQLAELRSLGDIELMRGSKVSILMVDTINN